MLLHLIAHAIAENFIVLAKLLNSHFIDKGLRKVI